MATKKESNGMTKQEVFTKLEKDGVIKKPTTAKKTTTKTSAAKKPATKTSTATKPKADAATKEAPKAEAKKPAAKKPTEKSLKKVAAKKPAPKKSAEKAPAQEKHPSRDKIFPKEFTTEFDFGKMKLTRLDVKNFDEAAKVFKDTEDPEDGALKDGALFVVTYWPKNTLLDYEGNCLPRYRMAPPTKGFEHDLDVSQVSYLQEREDLGISRFVCFSSFTSSTTAVYKSQMESRVKEGYFIAFDVECEFYMGTADEEAE